jgi:hypothetical protein
MGIKLAQYEAAALLRSKGAAVGGDELKLAARIIDQPVKSPILTKIAK